MLSDGKQYDRYYSALVTPYRRGTTDPDSDQMRRLVRAHLADEYVAAGIGLVVNPEAGEVFYLSREEQLENIEIVVEEAAGRVPVFAGVVDMTTAGVVERARDAVSAGVTGLFVFPPMGSMDVSFAWDAAKYPHVWTDVLKETLDVVGDVPLIVHPLTGRSFGEFGAAIPASGAVEICSEVPQIVGWKLTYPYSGGIKVANALRTLDRHVGVYAASGSMFHPFLAEGVIDGAVTGCLNYALGPMMAHIRAWQAGDHQTAYKLWRSGLAELHEYIFAETCRLHVRFKTAAWLAGLIDSPTMRSPMPKPLEEEIEAIRQRMEVAGMSPIDSDDAQLGAKGVAARV